MTDYTDTIEFNVSSIVVDAILNSCTDTLTDEEEQTILDFEQQYKADYPSGFFTGTDDVHPDIWEKCECLDVVCGDLHVIRFVIQP